MLDYLINNRKDYEAVYFPNIAYTALQETASPPIPLAINADSSMEKEILSYVEYGRVDLLKQALDTVFASDGDIPNISSDAERSMKNLFIVNLGVVSRTAYRGGVDYGTIIEITDYYMGKIENINGFKEVRDLMYKMFISFTQTAAMHNQIQTNTIVSNKIKQVVFSHINEKITPTLISGIINMDVSYICRHFKKDTGMTISSYINHVKISECRRLLTATDLTIWDIANRLGYNTHSYMSKVFKDIVGATPEEYRMARRV